MVRPKNCRLVAHRPDAVYYKPQGIPMRELEEETVTLDEVEALRLCDLEGLYHESAAEKMGVSRATLGRILETARRKVTGALIYGKALRIEGGKIRMTTQTKFQCTGCSHCWEIPFGTPRPDICPACGCANLNRTQEDISSAEIDTSPGICCKRGMGERQRGRGCRKHPAQKETI